MPCVSSRREPLGSKATSQLAASPNTGKVASKTKCCVAINPALLVNMRRPTALLVIGGCAVALAARATPARPRTRLQASLDSFLADRSAAKLFYDGVTDGALKSYDGPSLEDNSLDDQKKISALVDYMHTELMKKSMMADYTDEAAPLGDEFDDFIEEGRKMLAISILEFVAVVTRSRSRRRCGRPSLNYLKMRRRTVASCVCCRISIQTLLLS